MPKEKEMLDKQISSFLCFVSPYLRHHEAMCALEWLVHRFHVHRFNVDDLLRSIMPYHETGLFAKFLQLLDFRSASDEIQWLKPYAVSSTYFKISSMCITVFLAE